MRKTAIVSFSAVIVFAFILYSCNENTQEQPAADNSTSSNQFQYGGYESQVKWGEHLVTVGGCGDCHTPKRMTDRGPEDDSSMLLSGHPAKQPLPPVDPKEAQKKGLAVTQTLTAWIGPWGSSYAANLTPDSTGIGNWKEEQFIYAIRNGKSKGLEDGRPILPPMPWISFSKMTDGEIKAVFAYLKSIKPINNVVPQPSMAAMASNK